MGYTQLSHVMGYTRGHVLWLHTHGHRLWATHTIMVTELGTMNIQLDAQSEKTATQAAYSEDDDE